MDNYQSSSGRSDNSHSPVPIWSIENQVLENPDRKQTLYTYRSDDALNLYYMNKVKHWFWDPSSLSQSGNSSTIHSGRGSLKRSMSSLEPMNESQKRSLLPYYMYDALRQTEIPTVPSAPSAHPSSVNIQRPSSEQSITPTIDFFSNDVLFYNNGVFQRPERTPNRSMPPPSFFWNQDSLFDLDEESDIESVYSSAEEAEPITREDVKCQSLKDYNCPICFESPVSPVSTLCGHVFCEKCMKRLFRLSLSKWKCPQCRKSLSPADYHPLYLP